MFKKLLLSLAFFTFLNANTIVAQCVTATDCDGDGISNTQDLDDDNDGIIDTDEKNCISSTTIYVAHPVDTSNAFDDPASYEISNNALVNSPSGNVVITLTKGGNLNTTQATGGVGAPIGFATNGPTKGIIRTENNATIAAPAFAKYSFSQAVSNITVVLGNITKRAGSAKELARIIAYKQGAVVPFTTRTLGTDLQVVSTDWVTPTDVAPVNGLGDPTLFYFFEDDVDEIVFEAAENSDTAINGVTIEITGGCENLDTDSDGILDHLDTDSDNDGCPDAVEGAGNIVPAQLTTLVGGSAGGSSNNLGIIANTLGKPLVAGVAFEQANTVAVLDATDDTACFTDLNILKTVDKPINKVGQKVVFTLKLTNSGKLNATNVNVKDLLPAGLSYDLSNSVIPINTTYNAVSGIWDLSAIILNSGASLELKISATVTTGGTIIMNQTEIFSATEIDKDSTPNNNN